MTNTLPLSLFLGMAAFCFSSAKAQVLSCSPAPCVTSNVQIGPSTTSYTSAGFSLAASPVQDAHVLGLTGNLWNSMAYCYGSSGDSSETSVFTSGNQGLTWAGGCQKPSGSDMGRYQDPMSAFDINGTFYSGQLGTPSGCSCNGVFVQSLPSGSTMWGNFVSALSFTDTSTEDFYLFDFPAMTIDNNPSQPRIYVTALEAGTDDATGDVVSAIVVGVSSDNGSTWTTQRVSAIATYPTEMLYPRVAAGPNDDLDVTWIQWTGTTNEEVYSAYSTNFGSTYSIPVEGFSITNKAKVSCTTRLPLIWQVPDTCVRMFYYPQIAVGMVGTTQTLFAVYPDYNGGQVSTTLRTSSNNGSNWSGPTYLAAKSGSDQFEPNIAVNPSNLSEIGIGWLDTRASPSGSPDTLYDAYALVSTNGGATWGSLYRLSSASGNPSVTPVSGYAYLGDWSGLTFLNDYLYMVFPSTANGKHQVAMIAGLNP